MKNFLPVAFLLALFLPSFTWADTHIEEVWDCALREGKTAEELAAVNDDWLKFVNKQVKGGGIDSRMVTPLVGDLGGFFYVDSFPDLDAWRQMKEAMLTSEGRAIEERFDALMECSSNRLYASRS